MMSRNVRTQKAADDWNSKMLQQIAASSFNGWEQKMTKISPGFHAIKYK